MYVSMGLLGSFMAFPVRVVEFGYFLKKYF